MIELATKAMNFEEAVMPHMDAAYNLGVPLGTVMSRLARARRRLMLLLQGVTDYTDNKTDFQSVSAVAGITGSLQ